jgi:hypothetical protein
MPCLHFQIRHLCVTPLSQCGASGFPVGQHGGKKTKSPHPDTGI